LFSCLSVRPSPRCRGADVADDRLPALGDVDVLWPQGAGFLREGHNRAHHAADTEPRVAGRVFAHPRIELRKFGLQFIAQKHPGLASPLLLGDIRADRRPTDFSGVLDHRELDGAGFADLELAQVAVSPASVAANTAASV
jgi:hypothetical protein